MTDKQYAAQKKRVLTLLNIWVERLGLTWWEIRYTWDRSYSSDGGDCAAKTDMESWRYRLAGIHFFLPFIAECSDERVNRIVLHELCHVLLSPISVNMEDFNNDYQLQIMEFNTELVADALLLTYKAGQKEKTPEESLLKES